MKRRRVQTFVIGLVVFCSTTTVLLALGLLAVASAPFDKAYAHQRGAHTVATFDTTKVSPEQLARTARQPGVQAAAGPFAQAVVDIPEDWLWMAGGALTVVGRGHPAGPVDRIEVLEGRWATAPGEIVVNWSVQGTPDPQMLGTRLETAAGPTLTVVGFAASMSRSASAWVSPEQMAALQPTSAQMLYRFADSSTEDQLRAGLAGATVGLPQEALTGAQTYLALKQAFSALVDAFLPFMMLFGLLGLLVSTLIVGNVVSGAVVSGYRHIGVLKALGFTPNQVVAVYLTMLSVPAVVGSVLGTLAGAALAGPILDVAFSGIEVAGPRSAASTRGCPCSAWWACPPSSCWPVCFPPCAPTGCPPRRPSARAAHRGPGVGCACSGCSAAPGCRVRSAWAWASRSPAPAAPC
ncbi:ABC transporter permease [Micromonospora sp. KLBMP9576]|uniref:ABC transporter permease n=1 Tax=Micromonospora sp. KLBMP9576 TaxID=3424769 RepID=UPI003D8B7021